ncbi:hypothetical protein H0H87_007685 [Tephrocybe sp. NHM501043]|nr:hypothetical protein H0H87_007685 [Tephrocybe sp. NHM501043]
MIPRDSKGKERAVNTASEGDGGSSGIVLPLQVVGGGVYDIAYTIQVTVGSSQQIVSLQVDTGSSDLWIASKSCSASACGQTSGHLYDPSSSTSTDKSFKIDYLQGQVSGPIVWDKFVVGEYSIENQALAAADSITNEPLGPLFSGILGLALPLNSIIAQAIPPVTSNSPDGAAWASNLFSITPSSSAPSARFISLLLSRPGSDAVPSQLGIGRHPAYVGANHDLGGVQYDVLESEEQGTLFWKVSVREVMVWVNGEKRPVNIGRSNNGAVFPSAVLDSGVPLILTTTAVANGIYGAIGVSPAADGQYYVPCTTPLNLTITLDDRTPISLHPLDLTAEPADDNASAFCVGLIQPADSVLTLPSSGIGDIVLGVPFLRNTYSVMAYEPPDASGSFNTSSPSSGAGNIKPRLGIMGITDPTKALDEFNTVRVLNKPIPSSSGGSSSGSSTQNDGATVGKHISVGVIVLVALLGFFALCVGLFGIRWWLTRRRFRRGLANGDVPPTSGEEGGEAIFAGLGRAPEKDGGYAYALTSAKGRRDLAKINTTALELGLKKGVVIGPGEELYADEETMRSGRYEAYMQDHGLLDLGLGSPKVDEDGKELGYRAAAVDLGRDAGSEWGDDTLVMTPRTAHLSAHERSLSIGVPLLHEIDLERTRSISSSRSRRDELGAGVGVVPNPSIPPPMPIPLPGSHVEGWDGGGGPSGEKEFGAGDRTSMAGVGTVARGGKIGKWGEVEQTLSLRNGVDPSTANTATTSESGLDIEFREPSSGVGG